MTNPDPARVAEIAKRRGGYFVTGTEWSGPWATKEAAEFARDGEYHFAHEAHRKAKGQLK